MTTLTPTDEAEIKAHKEAFSENISTLPPSSSPLKFANKHLCSKVRSRRIKFGLKGYAALIANSKSDTLVGGWPGFNSDNITEESTFNDGNKPNDQIMMQQGMVTDDTLSANVVYSVDYTNSLADVERGPSIIEAKNRLSTHAFIDAVGVHTPYHVLNTDENKIYIESTSRTNYGCTNLGNLSEDANIEFDYEQCLDMLAVNILLGNMDLTMSNIMVGEDSSLITFDYNNIDRRNDIDKVRSELTKTLPPTLHTVNQLLPQSEISIEDILNRAAELASAIISDRVLDALIHIAKGYDNFFDTLRKANYGYAHVEVPAIDSSIKKRIIGFSKIPHTRSATPDGESEDFEWVESGDML